ncbi:MAG: family 10 glycosylhydrolase [Gemmatimonadaceae bacterium]|nr:family 10 glycosylhydrolase [Gemmatimonadaceae bacterium]MCC6431145.1 family 10 glycosylhydrolase [Gemmatimonadaceae bacterium]
MFARHGRPRVLTPVARQLRVALQSKVVCALVLLPLACRSRPAVTPGPDATRPSPNGAPVGAVNPVGGAASTAPATAPAASRTPTGRGTSAVPAAPARSRVSEDAPPPPREFRGVWVASVANIDWPSSRTLTTAQQQQELIDLLDRAAALKLNAVIFQVRPAADALYASKIEPWSEYLTGTQGRAPQPLWDPLEFAVREAHKRNLELHAWFNPYRAKHPGAKSALAGSHIARTNPSLVKRYGEYLWMDPGEKAVRERTVRVVLDVVQRYDIDGVHIDDYFYPYPETTRRGREIPFPDDASFKKYRAGGGTLGRSDWRRQNVDLLVQALNDGVHQIKPWVKFGISPFGIWRPGYPAQIRGFDAYEKLYADGRKWLREGWVDYFTPQLYWPTTKEAQSYPVLLEWWAKENVHARHLWPGNFTSRAGGPGASAFPVSELVEQIRVTRVQPGATGNVHFSMKSFLINQANMNEALTDGPYAQSALVPPTSWLLAPAPPVPSVRLLDGTSLPTIELGTYGKDAPWQWLVQSRTDQEWITQILPGTTTRVVLPASGINKVTVRAVNRLGIESAPISITMTVGPLQHEPADGEEFSVLRHTIRVASTFTRLTSRGRADGR